MNGSVIWNHSGFKEELEIFLSSQSKEYQGWLLGDPGYSQRVHMMVPFLEAERFNRCHKKCRCVIERSFGCLKSLNPGLGACVKNLVGRSCSSLT